MDEKQQNIPSESPESSLPDDFAQKILDSVPPIEDLPLSAPQNVPTDATMQYQAPGAPQNVPNNATMQYQAPGAPQNVPNNATMQYQVPTAPQNAPNNATMQYQVPTAPRNMQNNATMQYQVPTAPRNMQNNATMQYQVPTAPQNAPNNATMQYQVPTAPQNVPNNATMQYQVPTAPQNAPNNATMQYQVPTARPNIPDNATMQYQASTAPQNIPNNAPPKKKKIKGWMLGLIIGGGTLVLAGIIVLILFLCGVFSGFQIDVSDFYEIKIEGYDGYGKAEVVLKEDAAETIASDERYEILNTMTFTLTKEDHIQNGETIEATADYDEANAEEKGITITNASLTATAENLEAANVVDPFETLSISVEGVSPIATIELVDTSEEKLFTYGFKEDVTYVKNGDEITIVASYDEQLFEEKGLVAAETEMTYKVENLSEYVMSADMLTDNMRLLISESTASKLESTLESNRYSIIYKINDPDFSFMATLSFKDIQVEKSYLLTSQSPDEWSSVNMVFDQYKMTAVLSQDGMEREYTLYALVGVSDLIAENGALQPIESNEVTFYLSYLNSDVSALYDSVIKPYEGKYNIKELTA